MSCDGPGVTSGGKMTDTAESARQVATSKPVKIGARVGLVSYGITHLLIAWLALQVALGDSGEQADQSGAFQALAQEPLGRVLLWVLVVGFASTALWRLQQAIWGFRHVSDRAKSIRRRAGSAVNAVIFTVLAVLAGTAAAGGGGKDGKTAATAGVLQLPGGQLIVGAIGIGILTVGIVKIVRGWQQKFVEDMALPSERGARRLIVRLGQIGSIAKGASIGLIGGFVVVAAIRFRPEEASGLDAALKALAAQPYGVIMLIAVGAGLAAYGVFSFFDARYHRV
ncbi:DUF1206 domain-containing protein [Pseudonocardia sp. GCM10023141]|uniref:DUF1206 domain-containing protein n=1 Tax=Pseudonocardia sp. GCM10023141 TaxID=3252653 RepID=UPI00361EB769